MFVNYLLFRKKKKTFLTTSRSKQEDNSVYKNGVFAQNHMSRSYTNADLHSCIHIVVLSLNYRHFVSTYFHFLPEKALMIFNCDLRMKLIFDLNNFPFEIIAFEWRSATISLMFDIDIQTIDRTNYQCPAQLWPFFFIIIPYSNPVRANFFVLQIFNQSICKKLALNEKKYIIQEFVSNLLFCRFTVGVRRLGDVVKYQKNNFVWIMTWHDSTWQYEQI